MLDIKVVRLDEKAVLPVYQTDSAAGMDLCACIDQPLVIEPQARAMIATGLAIELPVGYEAQIRARSGLSINHGITMVNGVGTIDADYRGEIFVLVINLAAEAFTIEPNMRIAQMVVSRYERVAWQPVAALGQTARSEGGMGSTGTIHRIDETE